MLCNHFDEILYTIEQYEIRSIKFVKYEGNIFPVFKFHIKIDNHHAIITCTNNNNIEKRFDDHRKLTSHAHKAQLPRLRSSCYLKKKLSGLIQYPVSIIENLNDTFNITRPKLPHILNNNLRLGSTFQSRLYRLQISIGPITFNDYISLIQAHDKLLMLEAYIKSYLGPLFRFTVVIDVIKSTAPKIFLGDASLSISTWLGAVDNCP